MELLEREPFLAELNAAQAEAIRGRGRLALVSGEAGIGKTSLVDRFVGRRERAIRLFWGACDALFTPRPLGPLHDMAPEIGGELQAQLAAQAPRQQIFSTLLAELKRRPAIAVFEDIHWADEATFDLLRYLGRRIGQTSALLILTYRDDELGPRHPLRILLGDLAARPHAHRLALAPLSESAVRELVGQEPMDAAELHRQTSGNPFYVTEVLASPEGGVPTTIRDAVLARVARLSPSGLAVLEAAAVVGPRIEPWLLTEVTGAEAQAAEESLAAGMLLSLESELAFRHDLARNTILETIFPPRRQVLHRLVLDALKSSPDGRSDLTRLVHHAEAAGDIEAVLEYAPAAARQASTAGAHRAAATLFGLALAHAADLPGSARAAWLEAHARESVFINDVSAAVEGRRQAVELWRKEGNSLKEGENLAFLSMALNMVERWEEAEQTSLHAIQILETLPLGRELAVAYRINALIHLFHHDFEKGLELAEKAAALAEQVGDPLVIAMTCDTLGSVWMYLDYRRGSEILQRCLSISTEAGLDARAATVYANYGSIACELFQLEDAERLLAEGLAFTAERDLDHLRPYLLAWYGLTLLYLGRWKEAEGAAAQVRRETGLSAQSRVPALVLEGRLQSRRGEKTALPALAQALEIANRSNQFQHLAPVCSARAEAAWLAGNRRNTLEEARTLFGLAVDKRHPWVAGELAFWHWQAGEAVEITDWMARPYALQIAGDWQGAAAEWQRLGCPYERARALADGDQPAQIRALEIFKGLGAQPMAAMVRQKLEETGVATIPRGPRPTTRENPFGLTNRQVEILELLMEDLTNAQIADRLHISPKTVDHHVSAVLSKLGVATRQDAAALARQQPPPAPI